MRLAREKRRVIDRLAWRRSVTSLSRFHDAEWSLERRNQAGDLALEEGIHRLACARLHVLLREH